MKIKIAVAFFVGSSVAAFGQTVTPDQCKDVLKPELFNKVEKKQDTFLWLSYLASSTERKDQSSNSSQSGTIGYEGFSLGLSQSDAKHLSYQLDNRIDFKELYYNQTSVMLMSGDANIKAWTDCMKDGRTRLAMYFQPDSNNPKTAILHLQYFRAPAGSNPPPLKVSRVDLVGKIIGGDKECLRKDTVLKPGNECEINIATTNEWVSGNASISFRDPDGIRIPVSAYLSPRAALTFETVGWPGDELTKKWKDDKKPGAIDSLSHYELQDSWRSPDQCRDAPAGWVFLEGQRDKADPNWPGYGGSEHVKIVSRGSGATASCLGRYYIDSDGKRLCFGMYLKVGKWGDNYCDVSVKAELGRMVWKSSEGAKPAPKN